MIDLKIFHYCLPKICFLTSQRITDFLKSPLTSDFLKIPWKVCSLISQMTTGLSLKNLLRFCYPRDLWTDSLTLWKLTLPAQLLMRSLNHRLKTILDSHICCGCASAWKLETFIWKLFELYWSRPTNVRKQVVLNSCYFTSSPGGRGAGWWLDGLIKNKAN